MCSAVWQLVLLLCMLWDPRHSGVLLYTHRKIHLTVMRVKSVDGQEHTGVYLPWQHAQQVLNALKEAEPELANVKVAGGERSRK